MADLSQASNDVKGVVDKLHLLVIRNTSCARYLHRTRNQFLQRSIIRDVKANIKKHNTVFGY